METVIGVDISKETLDVHVWPTQTAITFRREDLRGFVKWVKLQEPTLVVMEATGGSPETLTPKPFSPQTPLQIVCTPCSPGFLASPASSNAKRRTQTEGGRFCQNARRFRTRDRMPSPRNRSPINAPTAKFASQTPLLRREWTALAACLTSSTSTLSSEFATE